MKECRRKEQITKEKMSNFKFVTTAELKSVVIEDKKARR